MKFQKGDFGFSYENDGMPLNVGKTLSGPLGRFLSKFLGDDGVKAGNYLKGFPYMGDGGDSYRTNAVTITMGRVSLDLNQFTGFRSKESYDTHDPKEMAEGLKIGNFGEAYPYGFVKEEGTPYRLGALTLGIDNYRAGLESDWIRHAFQDRFAHDIVAPQPGFQMQTSDWKGYSIFSIRNPFTSW